MVQGSLVVVGTGISVGQLTMEARGWIASAEKVLYCIADAATERLILKLNPNAESMYVFYGEGKLRKETYQQMVDRTMECVREGKQVCVAYYGHPGIFVTPSHRSIDLARKEGYSAKMLPAISSLDCMFCDIGFDPSQGCQTFEATDILLRHRVIDIHSHLVVWQIACVGDLGFSFSGYDCRHVPRLVEYLLRFYPTEHEAVVYEASQFPVCEARVERIKLGELATHKITGISTLYVPPVSSRPIRLSELHQLELAYILDGVRLVPAESALSVTNE
jgi:uncharacterized protein YabN with tetrapyrrole methylase and pyrophosphatase domain